MVMTYEQFIRELKLIRLAHKMTITDLHEESGISRPTISQIETGASNPSLSTIINLLSSLGEGYELRIVKTSK